MPDTVKAASPFVVMAKPAGSLCNLRCGYCYYLGTDDAIHAGTVGRMTDDTLRRFIKNYMESSPGPVVSFTWHGGEPTLAGLDFYRKAVALQKEFLPDGFSCWNSLQTNGLLLDEEWCAFLAEEHFDVGLSLDGDEENHDLFRRDASGNPTYARIAENARRLMAHGIKPDLLCTVTSFAAKRPLEVYRALRELDTGWIQFIPIVRFDENGALTPDSVTAELYGSFLCEVFDEWVRHDIGRLDVQLFAETANAWNGIPPSLCWMSQTCGRALIVERDGDVYSCDHFVDEEHRLGTVDDGLGVLAETDRQHSFGNAKRDTLSETCRACPYLPCCGGGCPKDRVNGVNILCDGLREFFRRSESQLKTLGALRRRGVSPRECDAALRAIREKMWLGVGRNDPCPCGSGKKAKKCCWDKRP